MLLEKCTDSPALTVTVLGFQLFELVADTVWLAAIAGTTTAAVTAGIAASANQMRGSQSIAQLTFTVMRMVSGWMLQMIL